MWGATEGFQNLQMSKEKYCLHLLATNIEDKQLPWHLILIVREIKNLTPQ
jgi:hypothetical protein